MRAPRSPRRRGSHTLAAIGFCGIAVFATGCGSESDDYANNPRPPRPINVTAAITQKGISVSPRSFGAGPVVLIVSNQTDESQQVTFATDDRAGTPGITSSTGPINPDGTATIKVDVPEGPHNVFVEGDKVRPTTVEVGPKRPSAQNDLLQP